MPTPLTRRHVLAGAAATAAVAAMPVAAMAAKKQAVVAGWSIVVNEATRPLLASLPDDLSSDSEDLLYRLFDATYETRNVAGPHRWVGVTIIDGELRVVGRETWSRRQALIDAGHKLEPLS